MKLTSLALAGLLAFGGVGVAAAQGQPAPGDQPPARQWQRPDPAQMAEQRAQRLRDTLQLRPDQEPALRAFLAASTRQPDAQRARPDRAARQAMTTPQRLDQMEQRMGERQARFRQVAEATRRFYAQLTPTQQKAFDAQHQGRGGGGRMGGRRGHDGHMRGMMSGHRGGGRGFN